MKCRASKKCVNGRTCQRPQLLLATSHIEDIEKSDTFVDCLWPFPFKLTAAVVSLFVLLESELSSECSQHWLFQTDPV